MEIDIEQTLHITAMTYSLDYIYPYIIDEFLLYSHQVEEWSL